MPKNHVRRARKKDPETEQERKNAKKEERAMCSEANTFLDESWNKFKLASIEAGMSLDQFESSMDRTAFNEGVMHCYQYAATGVLPDDPRARAALSDAETFAALEHAGKTKMNPIELMARLQNGKELADKQKAITAKSFDEFQQDETLINVYDTANGPRVHIYYNIALMLRCPTGKIVDYNLNMMENVVYMTTYDHLQLPIPNDEEWENDNYDFSERPTKWVIDTHSVFFEPMTTTLFYQFTGKVGSMLNLLNDSGTIHTDEKSAIFFRRTKNISEAFAVTFYLWAASNTARKLLRRSCNFCGKARDEDTFLCCARCKRIYYCSPACQKNGWERHKKICKEIRDDVISK